MNNYIYVCTIHNCITKENVYVFIDPITKEKKLSKAKDVFEEVVDIKLEELLNSDKSIQTNKAIKAAIVLGSSIVLTSFFVTSPTFQETVDNAITIIKNHTFINYSMNEYGNIDSFLKDLNSAINNNEYFTTEEKNVLNRGCKDLFYDWGHLYNNSELNGIVDRITKVKVHRNGTFSRDASGEYIFLNINVEEAAIPLITSHEVLHCIMDVKRGSFVEEVFGFGSALREAATETLNKKYIEPYTSDYTETYVEQRQDLLKLSLIVDKEDLIEKFLKEDISIDELISENCPTVSRTDIIKYVVLLDTKKQLSYSRNRYAYKITEASKKDEEYLYNKLYESKYNKAFDIDEITSIDFLDENVDFVEDGIEYSMPKRLFNRINFDRLKEYDMYIKKPTVDENSKKLVKM